MVLRRQSICHPTENVSFTDDGHAVAVAYSDLRGRVFRPSRWHRIGPPGFLGTSDLFVDAAVAWVKERSRAH